MLELLLGVLAKVLTSVIIYFVIRWLRRRFP